MLIWVVPPRVHLATWYVSNLKNLYFCNGSLGENYVISMIYIYATNYKQRINLLRKQILFDYKT